MEISRDQYIESFSTEDYTGTSMTEIRVIYLIAELSRRIDDRDKAIRYFSKVIEMQRNSNEVKIIEMAKNQWQQMREENVNQ